jgi:ubiquinone/menaquinone biosynthesis C-methylase UbiE
MTTITELKDQHRGVWASGRYADVAKTIADAPVAQLLPAIGIAPEHAVLDVATGTGNVALRAAEISPDVTGLDLVPSLLAVARERAAAAGLDVHWVEGDAEALPFGEETFDRVLSVVGAQFAPRHQIVADELVRVCRPSGAIGLVNWTPEGLVGRMFGVFAKYMPAPPSWASAPPKWGDEAHVRSLFAPHAVELSFERGTNPWVFPSVEGFMLFWEERYGPTIRTKARLEETGEWAACRADLSELFEACNLATDGSLHVEAEYLVTIARR